MLGIPLALFTANAIEWTVHKHLFHGRGKDPKSIYNAHMRHHGRVVRERGFDSVYQTPFAPLRRKDAALEVLSLVVLAGITTVPAPVAPLFTLTSYYCAFNYYRKHRRAHLDPEWARVHLPWHYDHHMNRNQDANWCVTRPLFDHIMGTRVYGRAERESNPFGVRLPRVRWRRARG